MHTKLITAALLAVLIGTAGAEEFYLKHDRTGKVYGPYQTDAGSRIKVGSATFTVVRKQKGNSSVEKTLSQINMREINFRNAALADCIMFLKIHTETHDSKGQAVNFVIVEPKPTKRKKHGGRFGASGSSFGDQPRATLELKDVSALEVFKLMMEQTGATYKISGNTVKVYPKK